MRRPGAVPSRAIDEWKAEPRPKGEPEPGPGCSTVFDGTGITLTLPRRHNAVDPLWIMAVDADLIPGDSARPAPTRNEASLEAILRQGVSR